MTAPDPRLDEIQAEEAAVLEAARALRDLYAEEVCKLPVSSFTKEARTALEAAHPVLLAELRKAHEALERVEEAKAKAYDKGYTHGREDGSMSPFRLAQRAAKSRKNPYRAAVAAAKGDEA